MINKIKTIFGANVTCFHCGKIYKSISEFILIRSLGLALKGQCIKCNKWINCNSIWKVSEIFQTQNGNPVLIYSAIEKIK
jgi:hypothetical protein